MMAAIANHWAAEGDAVTLLTFSSDAPFYDLDPRIEAKRLSLLRDSADAGRGLIANLKRLWRLRGAIRTSAPDVVISFIDTTNVLTLLATRGLGVSVIVSEHNDPAVAPLGLVWNFLRRVTYPLADGVVLLTERARSHYPASVREKAVVIPNPVAVPLESSGGAPVIQRPAVMAMGRLSREKGFDILLRAFAKAREGRAVWSLVILGEGTLRQELEKLAAELGVKESVHMPGMVKNPYDYLRQADIFALSSRFEGFPVSLLEAMACGAAVVSFDCATGPREIIRDGVDGVLVPPEDEEALAEAMGRLMDGEGERRRLGEGAKRVVERYGIENVMRMWEDLLGAASARRGRKG